MASDTALPAAVDRCAGFAEPATILPRLSPDEIHPARLAGPHAWHPWALTAAPPTDRHLRLVLPAGTSPEAAVQLLDRIEAQLGETPWPPGRQLALRRHGTQLHCRDDDARHSLIEIESPTATPDRAHAEVVNRDGWPILDELTALNDRIRCIDVDAPSYGDLADLANWVEHKMAAPKQLPDLTTSLAQLLSHQCCNHPATAERFQTILARTGSTVTTRHRQVLAYLNEQLVHHQCREDGLTLPLHR